jgi:penicillin V acylase-like amidase (Ntn superfamily)
VQADWAKYDKGNKGSLTPLEFGTWVLATSGQDMSAQVEKTKTGKQANLPAVKVLNATAAEFSKADKDRNRTISPDELTAYLSA